MATAGEAEATAAAAAAAMVGFCPAGIAALLQFSCPMFVLRIGGGGGGYGGGGGGYGGGGGGGQFGPTGHDYRRDVRGTALLLPRSSLPFRLLTHRPRRTTAKPRSTRPR